MAQGFPVSLSAPKRKGNNSKYHVGFHLENGSSQDQNLALTALFVPNLLGSAFAPLGVPFSAE